MKRLLLIFLCGLTALAGWGNGPSGRADTLVLNRVFSYQDRVLSASSSAAGDSVSPLSHSTNVYVKQLFRTQRRNAALWVVPTMYAIAHGERSFVSEYYGRFTFHDGGAGDYDQLRQVYCTTIPHQRRAMPIALELLMPRLYQPTLYGHQLLSPFCAENRLFYRYATIPLAGGRTLLTFRPRSAVNAQLVSGQAVVDTATGRVVESLLKGDFDMIHFRSETRQGDEGLRSLLPMRCKTDVAFRFVGNHITSHFETMLDCPVTLPDTLSGIKGDRQLMDSVRPYGLSAAEQAVYRQSDSLRRQQSDSSGTRRQGRGRARWDAIGDNLLHSLRAQSENGYVRLSPIINPQYVSYSQRKGFSYKLKLGAWYQFGPQTRIELDPTLGYNFKRREFYFQVPIRLSYNERLDGHADIVWGNDNRIGNSSVLDEIRSEQGDLPELADRNLDLFDDHHLRVTNSIMPLRWLTVETGLMFHRRNALNADGMRRFGKPEKYHSLAPVLGLKLRPWQQGPLFSIDYERGLRAKHDYLEYERWEVDASWKHRMRHLQMFNARLGGGFYTGRWQNYFMDFANFRDQNLPEGWDDDWTGNFQLLSSDKYNQSKYYVRGNVSYESPLLAASFLPLLGRYVERERVYVSSLLIEHTRPYSELGYGFTCRYFSLGAFASFLDLKFQEAGCKFTFELFRRW